jgi:DNA-binding phage protein
MNFEQIAADWLRFMRGKRSQRAFSRRLGYRSNIAFRWESGVCFPTAAEAFAISERFGLHRPEALAAFHGSAPARSEVPLGTRAGVAALLRDLQGQTSILEIARRSGHSRFSVSRWLSGKAEPRLPELLSVVEAASFRLLDLLSQFTDPSKLPSVADDWRALVAARKAAYDLPWSHAFLRGLELSDYQALPKHRPGWLARRLGVSIEEERRCLQGLLAARQIRLEAGRYVIDGTQSIDTRSDPAKAALLKQQWLRVALKRLQENTPGTFGYNVMAVSLADFERLRQLHIAYFRSMQAIVADSAPSERVVLFNTQLFALDDPV